MLRIEIPTAPLADSIDAGKPLADLLRKVADRVESEIRIVPAEDAHEWTPEIRRVAGRFATEIDGDAGGVLIGAVITLDRS